MIELQKYGHFFGGYRNKTDCIATCDFNYGELPKSLEEINYIIDLITSIQFEHCVNTVVSFIKISWNLGAN